MAQTPGTRQPPAGEAGRHEESDAERAARAQREERAARDEAEAKTAHLPAPGTPVQGPQSGAQYAAAHGEDTVKMNFPTPVTLTLPDYTQMHFPAGVQEVPASVAEDPYLAASGATPV
jgi:hypothetical protein